MEGAELELERRSTFLSSLIKKKKEITEQEQHERLNVRVRASDMPLHLQHQAFRCARDSLDSMPNKLDSKQLALALKKTQDWVKGRLKCYYMGNRRKHDKWVPCYTYTYTKSLTSHRMKRLGVNGCGATGKLRLRAVCTYGTSYRPMEGAIPIPHREDKRLNLIPAPLGYASTIPANIASLRSLEAIPIPQEFDSSYGPAWHCIVGTSFGSYVTHSLGGFVYFSIDKVYVLLFKTSVEPLDK
ncbi:hypothetical protein GIB67_000104 [Kingdonia uniflora]|uniref:Dynein light chain n=1 Tax=Kingdonia uniflora TaxID=39325 RepID=A0A7J7M5Z5_9MAGN|nr:hypothetical protein GIB67_000104 [Kingdonia uniflora]